MINGMTRVATFVALAVLLLTAAAMSAKADSSFDVSLNTSSLSGTQMLAFGLVSGGGGVDNTVTLSDFAFGGGSAVPPASDLGTGGVSGDLSGTITMDDSSPNLTVLFAEEFDPGSSLSFLLNTTNNFAGTTPDAFAMYVCDTSFNCYSDDTSTAMLILNLTGAALAPSSFDLFGASGEVDGVDLPAPVVTTASGSGATPEPSTLLLLSAALLALIACSRAKRVCANA